MKAKFCAECGVKMRGAVCQCGWSMPSESSGKKHHAAMQLAKANPTEFDLSHLPGPVDSDETREYLNRLFSYVPPRERAMLANKFLYLTPFQRQLVIAYNEDGVQWHGEDMHVLEKIMDCKDVIDPRPGELPEDHASRAHRRRSRRAP